MKLISWNVNGIRAAIRKGAEESLRALDADIYCFQEVRAMPEQFSLQIDHPHRHWYPAQKAGYSGTGIAAKSPLLSVTRGMGIDELDQEGRVLTAELPDFFLVNVYTPNSGRELSRLDYRTKKWDTAFLQYAKQLEQKKPVIVCGDLNVAHREIDLANPKQNVKNAGFTPQERATFSAFLDAGFVDTFRVFESGGGHYTWWSNFGNSRARNIGWRIDYFIVSQALVPRLRSAAIHPDIMGSDHCPVSLEIA